MSKILVIDDNELLSAMLKEQLSHEGYDVVLAHDANAGYSSAIEFLPDLILLDVQLPDVVGFDLIRIIKNREDLAHIPIMMITGTAHKSEEKVKGFQLGADDYVLKPFDMPELLERIKVLLRRHPRAESARNVPDSSAIADAPIPMTAPARASDHKPRAALFKAMEMLLLTPQDFPLRDPYPPSSLAFLIGAATIGFVGLAASAGTAIKPSVFALVLLTAWVLLVSVLVMTCSVIGVGLPWKEGGRLFSLAMTPLLLKVAGGTFTSFWTSLSPFFFTASPALFFKSAPFWTERLDIFEMWSAGLLWWLLLGRPASSKKRAGIVVAMVWISGVALAVAVHKVGD